MTSTLAVWKAILAGQLVVNLPVVAIIVIVALVGSTIVQWPFAMIAGSLIAWLWWSFTVPRWRDWAHHRGVDPGRLQKFAWRTGLTWPKGSIFESTEFHRRK